MAVKLELYLIRHGESKGNTGETDGLTDELKEDAPLTEKGIRQAQLLGEYLKDLKIDALFSSGLRRALSTAHEIALRQSENGAKQIEVHKIFTECNTGTKCKGRTIEEIKKENPFATSAEGTDKNERIVFHGENDTDEMLLERGKDAINYLLGRFHNGEKVAVVAHGAFNTFMMYAALGLSHEQIFDPQFFNTSLTKIVFFEEGTGKFADVHLLYQNATPHLCGEFKEFRY